MAKMSFSSQFCGHTHTISGKVEWNRVIVEIDTPCEKFKGVSHLEFPLMEISDTQEKRIMELAKDRKIDCSEDCPIPHAILNIYSIEKEFSGPSEENKEKQKKSGT